MNRRRPPKITATFVLSANAISDFKRAQKETCQTLDMLKCFIVDVLSLNWKKNFREFFVGNKKGQLWSLKSRKKCLTRASYADGRQRWPVDILRGRPSGAVNISDARRTNNNNRKKKKVYKNYDVATPHFIDFTTATPEIDGALIASSVLNNQVIRWKWAKMKESISTLIDGTRWLL